MCRLYCYAVLVIVRRIGEGKSKGIQLRVECDVYGVPKG
jgi:hypothetical protein